MILRFLTDQDFNDDIVAEVRSKKPDLDLISVREIGMARASDPNILEWAAQNDRVLLTHDVNTMTAHATQRLRAGLSLAGVVIVPQLLSIGKAVEDILLIVELGDSRDVEDQLLFLPL